MNESRKTCAECGAELKDDAAGGLCPLCLLKLGLGSQTDPDATVVAGGSSPRRALPEIGGQFGPYRILRLLGRGGMGVVYEAEEQDTGRRVALKVLGQKIDSPADRARFLREGRLAASINHPNSVYVYGTEEIGGTPTIAMELVSGGTLQRRVRDHGPLAVPTAVDAMLQIIAGLEAAQAIGILHRDIKPGNCFEDADGTIKIGDFGLSISTAARAEPSITAEGAVVGTPAFCSPEQLRGEELSARADMYAVGGTLFYLLTGRAPFEGNNIAQLIANALEQPAPSPRALRREIPQGLAGVIQRCLAKQPAERFRTYSDLRQALAPYGSTAPTPATLGLRSLAGILDGLLTSVVFMAITFLCFGNPFFWLALASQRSPKALLWLLGSLLAVPLYYALGEGLWGAAVGKAICGLRVVRPDRNPPGFWRALGRAALYHVLPPLPYWIAFGINPPAMAGSATLLQQVASFSYYVVLALLFCTARRRNGFAAVHDLVTKTQVISRAALESRPALSPDETPPPVVEGRATVGPYQVLETWETNGPGQWLLGYDLRLLRKVWIRSVSPGTPPLPAPLRNIGRVGRLRWLTGRRTAEENWDAFEGVSGQPLLGVIQDRQPWSRVRFWLYDLAREIAAAEKDGTLPEALALDRVWITGEGQAKLLDFSAPTLASDGTQPAAVPATATLPEAHDSRQFLGQVAVAALEGRPAAAATATVAAALPLHAREFLQSLPQYPHTDTVAGALKPLLLRVASVSRWRRAAVVAGCAAVPAIMGTFLVFAVDLMEKTYPGLMELSSLLQQRHFLKSSDTETNPGPASPVQRPRAPTQGQIAVFIASHDRALISDDVLWNSPIVQSVIRPEDREFIRQSMAEHPAPTEQEIAAAETAVKPLLDRFAAARPRAGFLVTILLAVYVGIPALLAALLFRGGLALRIAGVTFVRRDGQRASRLRVFWRALVAWSPCLLAMFGASLVSHEPVTAALSGLPLALYSGLAILSTALPQRGLPDRLAGTWPVPR